jgi:hypothetical protein
MIVRFQRWPWLLLALAAYYLPWVYHRAAALTFNANDLAEWTNLAPAVRSGPIPLLIPLLLRAVLALLALLFGLHATSAERAFSRWGYAFLAIILAITLLPPAEFFRGAWDDANYRQQFGIAMGTTVGLVAISVAQWRSRLEPYRRRLEIAIALLCIIFAIVGNVLALNVVRSYQIDATLGGGLIALIISLILNLLLSRGKPQ